MERPLFFNYNILMNIFFINTILGDKMNTSEDSKIPYLEKISRNVYVQSVQFKQTANVQRTNLKN